MTAQRTEVTPNPTGLVAEHVRIAEIRVGDRHRKDFGDLDPLAASIAELGLLQPIGITPDHLLVFGLLRFLVCRDKLGWETIPARVIDLKSVLEGEFAENALRKDWTVSEKLAIVESLRTYRHGGDRRSDQAPTREDEPLTVDSLAKLVGLGGKDGYGRARSVVERGVPELVGAVDRDEIPVSVAAEMAALKGDEQRALLADGRDWTVKQVAAHRQRLHFREVQRQEQLALAASTVSRQWVVTGDEAVVPCDLLIADPPFGILEEAWEPPDVEQFTRDWCRRWAACGADFIVVFWCQGRLREGWRWFDEALEGYAYQQVLIWQAPNHCNPKSKHVLKQTWYPVFLYRRKGSDRAIIAGSKTWTNEMHVLDCHTAPVPQSGYGGAEQKVHPCQKPVSVMKWLINALSEQGSRVASVFCGSAPCGVAALQLGRQYHGVEADEKYRKLAEDRLLAYGRPDPAALPVAALPQNEVVHGNCLDLIPLLPNRSVNLVLTSPPYAEQRSGQYPGVPAVRYPEFTVRWMSALWDRLMDDGSVAIVIRPDLKNGALSDYVLRTRLAVRDAGWTECETLIWHKPDGGACMGSPQRPRRTFEEILWFSKAPDPFVDTKACGREAGSVSFTGSPKPGGFRLPRDQPARTRKPGRTKVADVISAAEDVINVPVRHIEQGVGHPAMFPERLAATLIKTLCPPGGTVLDPFAGSGSTLVAAKRLGHPYHGFEVVPEYCDMARTRLARVDKNDSHPGDSGDRAVRPPGLSDEAVPLDGVRVARSMPIRPRVVGG